jgi:hypothetical protein
MSSVQEIKQALFKYVDHFQPPFDIYEYTYEYEDVDYDEEGVGQRCTCVATRDVIVHPDDFASYDPIYYHEIDDNSWFMPQHVFEQFKQHGVARLVSSGSGVVTTPAKLPYIPATGYNDDCQIDSAFTISAEVREYLETPIYTITYGWSFDRYSREWYYVDLWGSNDPITDGLGGSLFQTTKWLGIHVIAYILRHMRAVTNSPPEEQWYEIDFPERPGKTLFVKDIIRLR